LSRLHRLENAGRCQVLYGDESGFCLQPPLSYLWQKKGQTVGLPAKAHSRRLNALGSLSRAGCLHHFETQERITLSKRDFDRFVALIDNPKPPPELQNAMAEYNKLQNAHPQARL